MFSSVTVQASLSPFLMVSDDLLDLFSCAAVGLSPFPLLPPSYPLLPPLSVLTAYPYRLTRNPPSRPSSHVLDFSVRFLSLPRFTFVFPFSLLSMYRHIFQAACFPPLDHRFFSISPPHATAVSLPLRLCSLSAVLLSSLFTLFVEIDILPSFPAAMYERESGYFLLLKA